MNEEKKDKASGKLRKNSIEGLFDHPTEDISIAGEAIQPLPSIFHGLLQTVSDLMLLLPVGSALQQIAITCWCIKFRPQDHNFLHQSHVFSTISKILSRSEEFNNESAPAQSCDQQQGQQQGGGLHPTNVAASQTEESTLVEGIIDLTPRLELKVSSRVAMVGSLNDNSTETFWESCDEDRNKSKWVTASLNGPAAGPVLGLNKPENGGKIRIKSISVHI